jgi:Domain of unknown function (DUF4190)
MTTPQDPGPPGYPPAPGWSPGGYVPPGYGQPGYPPYPPVGYPRPTNTLAILALVFAFVAAPAGLIMGIIARRQIQRTGEEGAGLALAGIIVGGVFTALFVLLIVVYIVIFAALARHGFGP